MARMLGLITGQRSIDEEIAALETKLGTSKEFWIARQRRYDESIIKKKG